MNSSKDHLKKVLDTYQVTQNALTVADKALDKEAASLFRNTDFVISPEEQAKQIIKECSDELSDLVTISLWAVFQRFVTDYLLQKGVGLKTIEPEYLAPPLHKKFVTSVEYWRFEDVLKLFKPVVGEELVKKIKVIKTYRDFIAHRNPQREKPDKPPTPVETYNDLTKFIQKTLAVD